MKQYQAILFDLDGTLLPMDQDAFVSAYFHQLCKTVCAKTGVEAKALVDHVWAGTREMAHNDGSCSNEACFWEQFSAWEGVSCQMIHDACNAFYRNEFHEVHTVAHPNPYARRAIDAAHAIAPVVVLATNPVFPMDAQRERLSWIGLHETDFDWITSYENSCFCKPNAQYYLQICTRMHVTPQLCLMIGNNEGEDMFGATTAGMEGYLVTDHRINDSQHPWSGAQSTFSELTQWLEHLAKLKTNVS